MTCSPAMGHTQQSRGGLTWLPALGMLWGAGCTPLQTPGRGKTHQAKLPRGVCSSRRLVLSLGHASSYREVRRDWLLPFFLWLCGARGGWRNALPAHRSCSDIATSSPQTLICPRLPGLPWPASLRHLIKLFRRRPGRIRSPLPLRAPRDAGDSAGEAAARRAPRPSSSAGCCPGAACPAARHRTGRWKWGSRSSAHPGTPNRDQRGRGGC